MAETYIDPEASTGNEPRTFTGASGMEWTTGSPTQATEEQNQRVRMILEALKAGVSPSSQGVPNASGLMPVYSKKSVGDQPISLGSTPFELAGYRGPGGDDNRQGGPLAGQQPPADKRNALLNALRTRPQETIQALSQMSQQLKGVPDFAQKQIYGAMGMGETPKPPTLTPTMVEAAAAGHPVPGLSPQMAQRILQQKTAQTVQTDIVKKQAEDIAKGGYRLGSKAKLFFDDYGKEADASMTAKEAETKGFRERTPQTAEKIPAARSVYFTTKQLRPLIDKLLVKVQQQEKDLPWYTKFMGIQKNRIAMDLLRKSGDTDVRLFDAHIQAGLARYLMGLGIPGGRETVALLQRMSVEFPDSSDSKEAALGVLDYVDDMMQMASGIKKPKEGPQVPRVKMGDAWYLKMGNDWYIDPNQK